MSKTVHLRGKAIKIAAGEACQTIVLMVLEDKNKLDKVLYYDNALECLCDIFDQEYFYHPNSKTLYKITHQEIDEEDEIIKAKYNFDSTIDYELKFYNGGAGFSECLEEAFDKMYLAEKE